MGCDCQGYGGGPREIDGARSRQPCAHHGGKRCGRRPPALRQIASEPISAPAALAMRRGGCGFRAAGRWPCHTRAQLGPGPLLHGHTGGRLALVYPAAEYRSSGAIRPEARATRAGRDQPSSNRTAVLAKAAGAHVRSQVAIAGADQPQLDRDRPGPADPSDLARAWSPVAWPGADAGQRRAPDQLAAARSVAVVAAWFAATHTVVSNSSIGSSARIPAAGRASR
jgi:hypothetical protein